MTTLDLIDVVLCDDLTYQEDGPPYLASLQPLDLWTFSTMVEVWPLPEGWTETDFLEKGYTKTTAKLNGHQLYAPNHLVSWHLGRETCNLWYALHPTLEIIEYALDVEVQSQFCGYDRDLVPERLTLKQQDWRCCQCKKKLDLKEIQTWAYKAKPFNHHSKTYCSSCLSKHLKRGDRYKEYTIVNQSGEVLSHHPYFDEFAILKSDGHREPDGDAMEPVYDRRAYEFCQQAGVEIFSWLPGWQRRRKERKHRLDWIRKAARSSRNPERPTHLIEYHIISPKQVCLYRTEKYCHQEIRNFIFYLEHSSRLFGRLYPEQCIQDALGGKEIVSLLSHYYSPAVEGESVESHWIEQGDDGGIDECSIWLEMIYKTCYRPGLQQSIQHYMRTGELFEWSPFMDTKLEGLALVIQEIGERGFEYFFWKANNFYQC